MAAAELTPELHEALVECRRRSRMFDAQVGQRCGVEAGTLRRWLRMGLAEDAQEPYLSFARDYSDASTELENEALEQVCNGLLDGWKATAWWLERWAPTRWGAQVPVGGPRDAINIQSLVEESERRSPTLDALFSDPPPELENAMRQNREAILAILAQPEPEKLPE